jgi:DNA-binding transcriptional LysR family regulator
MALAEHSNLHRAAEAVHMAQPSATKVVRDLERSFGFRLFERLPRGMHPTELGTEVLAFALGYPVWHARVNCAAVASSPVERSFAYV